MGCCGPKCCGIFSLVSAVVAAVMAATLPMIIDTILDQQLSLRPGTITYKYWEHSPVPMYINFYFFNITNTEAILLRNEKPILEEIGPYTFTEVHEKVNVESFDNYTLRFQQNRLWNFVPELSNGTLRDYITTLNVPILGASYTMRFAPNRVKKGFNYGMSILNEKLFVTKLVSELLFDGYDDPLLFLSKLIPDGYLTIPPYDKFGWFYKRNNTPEYDGYFNIFTGVDDISKLDVMDTWNGVRQTKYYESHCGMVNGSFGEGWPPRRDRTTISLYSTDLCRSITLDYTNDIERNGVTFYRFAGTERMFSNPSENPDNWCFCSGGVCNPSGVANTSTCRYGSPAFVSFPHYYLADPYYQDQVEGLNPQQDQHEFRIDLEPRMAVPSQVRARFQINILIEPVEGLEIVENLNRTYVPVLWFGVSADLSDNMLWWVRLGLISPTIGSATSFAVFAASMIAVAVCGVIIVRRRKAHSTEIAENDGETEEAYEKKCNE